LRLLVINIASSSPTINKLRRLLPASVASCGTVVRRRRVDNTWPVVALTARTLRIAISAYPTSIRRPREGGSRQNIANCHAVWNGNTRMLWLPDGDRILKIFSFVLTECTNVTDTQTPHDDIGRGCIASRGKNNCHETRCTGSPHPRGFKGAASQSKRKGSGDGIYGRTERAEGKGEERRESKR